MKEIILGVLALLSCSGVTGIIMYFITKRDRTVGIEGALKRQSESISCLIRVVVLMSEALHEKKIIDGQNEQIRKELKEYLLKCAQDKGQCGA